MEIMPALLVDTADEFLRQIKNLSPFFKHFQVDIADGKFVPDKTITLEEVETAISNPACPLGLTFDFDLLVKDVKTALEQIDKIKQQASVETVFIHNLEAFNVRPNLAIAIDPQVSVETIKQRFDLSSLPAIQVMSVIPGAQGRAFIPETLDKIGQLRKAAYKNKIYLDGGINNQTTPIIIGKQYRPDFLCIGSYLTHAENPEERVKQLNNLVAHST